MRKWYLVFLLPLYNFVVFWFRFAGIINSMKSKGSWKMQNFSEETQTAWSIIKHDFRWLGRLVYKVTGRRKCHEQES